MSAVEMKGEVEKVIAMAREYALLAILEETAYDAGARFCSVSLDLAATRQSARRTGSR